MGLFSKAEFKCDACEVHATGLNSYEAFRLAELHLHPADDSMPVLAEDSTNHPTNRKEG